MKVFIVDGNALIIQLLTRLCEDAGHSVSSAEDGYDALQIITTTVPDVAFIDLIMPRVGGDTLCRIIRRIPACNSCRLVLMSGAASEVDIDLAHVGADFFLAKGATRTMIENVRKVLADLTAADASSAESPMTVGMEDVLKRRITTELLARREHLQEVLNTVFNGVVEIDDGKIMYANTAAAYLMGRPLESLTNTLFTEHFAPEVQSRLNDFLSTTGNGDSLSEALPLRNRMVRVKRARPPEGGAAGDIIIIVDVTDAHRLAAERENARLRLEDRVQQRRWQLESIKERLLREAEARKQSLARLEAEENRFEQFMRFLPAAAFIKDEKGRYLFVNDAFCRTFNVDRAGCLEYRDRDFLEVATAEQMEKNDQSVRLRKSSLSTVETVGQGDARTYYVTTRFPIFRNTEPPLVGGVVMDISEQKRLAEERFEMQQHIHRLRKMEAIGVLAGEMAHELNNLLSGLVSYPDYLLTVGGPLSPDFREKIERTKLAGERAAAVVTDVLHLAGGDMQKRILLDLNQVLDRCVGQEDIVHLLPADIRFETRPSGEPVWVRGTEGLLCKIMRRLLDYGVANIGSAGGAVSLGVEAVCLSSEIRDFQTIPAGDYGVISFTETGPPLSAEEREQLFEPFFLKERLGRIDSGLWMSVVWGIVKAHEGYVALGTEPGGGSRFRIFLPRISTGMDASYPKKA
ncbi:MAG: response regulator [Pseudomonadota bacterium]